MTAARVDEMLRSGDPWALMDALADDWSEAFAELVDARFDPGTADERKRLVWLLGRVRDPSAAAVLLGWLPRARGSEAGAILSAMNARRWPVPSREIRRLLEDAPEAAVVAAGLSGDASLAPLLEARLGLPNVGRHAALALALLGRMECAPAIAGRIAGASTIDAAGFAVALETMQSTHIIPTLRGALEAPTTHARWDVHHALCRLSGREPLVPLDGGDDALAIAWRSLAIDAPRAPALALEDLTARTASFTLHDGAGAVRLDYLPPTPGSAWPRWSLALYVGERALYQLGSHCGTCETTLVLAGAPPMRAAAIGERVRDALTHVASLDGDLFAALEPYLGSLRTGHYRAYLRDLDLELVETPKQSWFTRRHYHRVSEDTPVAEGPSPDDVEWPGIAHFQTRRGPRGHTPTYGVVVPSMPLDGLSPATVASHAERIARGDRPCAMLLGWVEDKCVRGEFQERFANMLVLDGHHKLAAYAGGATPARCLVLCRVEDSWGPPEDREGYLRAALTDLSEP